MTTWTKVKQVLATIWRKLRLADVIGAALAILKAAKREGSEIDKKYIVVKPRILSDHNLLRGVAALKAVLAFVPPASVAVPVLSLGEVGFQIWKRIALAREYDQIKFPPIDPNVLRVSVELDEELKTHYGELILTHNWNEEAVGELEKVYNDFSFITSFELLRAKYPHVDEEYIKGRCSHNRDILQANLYQIEQEIQKVSHRPEINANVQAAVEALREIFPAMRDWSLFNSDGFDELVELIDTVV
jgi:hypothetical protein